MDQHTVVRIVVELLAVLAVGLVAGAVCRRIGVSMLVGYLVSGAVLGSALPELLSRDTHELEYLAEAGVLLLLFSIGIEFSLADLLRIARPLLVGGSAQFALVAVPVALVGMLLGLSWQAAVLLGAACAFSSTVLVFKVLDEWGQTTSPHGRRAIAILFFQDAAVVPLVLLVPLLAGGADGAGVAAVGLLFAKSIGFLAVVPVGQRVFARWLAPWLARLRSVELIVLFTVVLLGGMTLGAHLLDLPPMIGAFGAGLMLNGNRLTRQIDAVILPFRETFAAVFFVSLGTLIRLDTLLAAPLACLAVVAGVLVLKASAAAVALRLAGLPWRASLGMGLGLGQIGEFALVLLLAGLSQNVIAADTYDLMMFVAVVTLIASPQLLKMGLRLAEGGSMVEREIAIRPVTCQDELRRAAVIGIGPVGSQIASQLEIKGYDVGLVDLSPVNLHGFAQQGFRTVAGNGAEQSVLAVADVENCSVVVVTVPDDHAAMSIVSAVRRRTAGAMILVRCRFQANLPRFRKAGANDVFSEEAEVAVKLVGFLEQRL